MEILGELKNTQEITLFTIYKSVATKRNRSFRIHHHIECELGLILRGRGIYKAEEAYPIQEGSLFFYKSNEPHCITDITTEDMEIINLHIAPEYFRHLRPSGTAYDAFGIDFLSRIPQENLLNHFLPETSLSFIVQSIFKMTEEFKQADPESLFMAETLLNGIIIELSKYFQKKETDTPLAQACSDAIFKTAAYINEHFSEALSLELLADMAGLTRTYYSAAFRKVMGITVWEYISIKRIDYALLLLRSTDKNVLEIAGLCGFNNSANFNKTFKKYTGQTPKKLR